MTPRWLIHGAAGAVGCIAVQLAREAGARVIGSGRADQRDTVLGADAFVSLQQDRLEDVGEVDVVFDVIGGKNSGAQRDWCAPGAH